MHALENVVENPLTERALGLLRCPSCKGSLLPGALKLECSSCQISYPVVKGVPVLLDEKKSVFRVSEISMEQQKPPPRPQLEEDCQTMAASS